MTVNAQYVVDAIPHILANAVPGYILFSIVSAISYINFNIISQAILSILLSYGTIHIVDMVSIAYGRMLNFWTSTFYCIVFDVICGLFVVATSHMKHPHAQIARKFKSYCKEIAIKERFTHNQTTDSTIRTQKMDATNK